MMSSNNVSSMSNADVGKAFNAVVKGIGRNDIGEILFNWNESQLNMDGDKIIGYPGRDGVFSRGKEGGKVNIGKREQELNANWGTICPPLELLAPDGKACRFPKR